MYAFIKYHEYTIKAYYHDTDWQFICNGKEYWRSAWSVDKDGSLQAGFMQAIKYFTDDSVLINKQEIIFANNK